MENPKSKACEEAMTLEIIRHPNQVLRTKAKLIEKITTEIFDLAESMSELMLKRDGVGLAANQVGQLWRLCVINTSPFDDKPTPVVVINPRIIQQEGAIIDEEGCLSFPGLYLNIERAGKVLVQMQNLYNEKVVYEAEGLLARVLQHEIDHLDAVLIIDHAGELDREKVKSYLEKLT